MGNNDTGASLRQPLRLPRAHSISRGLRLSHHTILNTSSLDFELPAHPDRAGLRAYGLNANETHIVLTRSTTNSNSNLNIHILDIPPPNQITKLTNNVDETADPVWRERFIVHQLTRTKSNFSKFRFVKPSPIADCRVGGVKLCCLPNSGSEICVLSEDLIVNMESYLALRRANWGMFSADEGRTILYKVIPLAPVEIYRVSIEIPIFSSPYASDLLSLGRTFEVKSQLKS
jgi:hypothetical protein